MADLTAAEMAFFATGEVTDELLAAEPAAAAPEVVPEPTPEPAPAPAAPDNSAIERLLAEERQARADLEAKFVSLQEQLTARAKAPEVPPPDEETDPLGAMMHQLKTVNGTVADLQQKLLQEQQQTAMKAQYEQFTKSLLELKDAFVKTAPDFMDAYKHIREVRALDLRMLGVSEPDISRVLLQDEITISQNALAKGKNPAEEMYNMAKRYGYATKAGAPAAAGGAEKIAALKSGIDAAKQPARAAPDGNLTLEGLKDATNSDLDKMVHDDKLWAKLVGGASDDIF